MVRVAIYILASLNDPQAQREAALLLLVAQFGRCLAWVFHGGSTRGFQRECMAFRVSCDSNIDQMPKDDPDGI